jgi:hypothetical protein
VSETASTVKSRERQAALLSVHHHTGRIVVPSFLMPDSLRVMPLKQSLGILKETRTEDSGRRVIARGIDRYDNKRNEYLNNACMGATFGIRPENDVANETSRSDEDFDPKGFLTDFGLDRPEELPKDHPELPEDKPGPCSCCAITIDTIHSQTGQIFPILYHEHAAWVDIDSSVTTVVVRMKLGEAGTQDWFRLFSKYADPEHWKQTAPEFFAGSRAAKDAKRRDNGSWSGKFHEIATWTQDSIAMSEFHNVLDIDFHLFHDKPATTLRYTLIESIYSRVAGETEDGGLDVDDGYMIAYYDKGTNSVLVEVLKKIRFTDRQSPTLPGGANIGQLLNFVAPSFVGLWLDRLVYEGALDAFRKWNHNRKSAPAPSPFAKNAPLHVPLESLAAKGRK